MRLVIEITVRHEGLSGLEQKIDRVLAQGESLIMSNAEINRFLDELNEHTNALAAAATVQAEKIGEISADIDDLIANGGGLDDATRARLEAMKTTLAGIAEAENAQAAHLTEIATKHDAPLPELPAAAAGKTRKARK